MNEQDYREVDSKDLSEAQRRQLERMLSDKFICDLVGIRLTQVGVGTATAELSLTPSHLNGVGICQGGVLFSLADYALAAAFNYSEESVVSLDTSISYCRSARAGDRLIASAKETERTRTTTLGDVVITDESGRTIACLRGRGYILGGCKRT